MSDGAPKGTWSTKIPPGPYRHMLPGRRYRVVREFIDFDKGVHPVGEEWTYLCTAFLPYDAGRSIFVSFDGTHEWHIRMQDYPEEQQPILDALPDYIEPIP